MRTASRAGWSTSDKCTSRHDFRHASFRWERQVGLYLFQTPLHHLAHQLARRLLCMFALGARPRATPSSSSRGRWRWRWRLVIIAALQARAARGGAPGPHEPAFGQALMALGCSVVVVQKGDVGRSAGCCLELCGAALEERLIFKISPKNAKMKNAKMPKLIRICKHISPARPPAVQFALCPS